MIGTPVITSPALSIENNIEMPQEFRKDHVTFNHFIFQNKANRNYLLIATIAAIIQFMIFKILYPYADFFSDSYSYIYGADDNLSFNIWPIGYSWFLRYFHFITSSDTAVVSFQYFFLILSLLVLFFTVRYFYKPAKSTSNILFIFLFFNPLFLYVCNYINSDPLFAALSVLWLTQLIWIIHRPMIYQVVTHGILLYLCFIVRNNAMIYPFLSIAAFLLSNHRRFIKLAGIGFGLLLVLLFINHQRNAAYRLYGQKEFSIFTGWQLANNALYVRGHIDLDPELLPSPESRRLDSFARVFFSSRKPDFNQRIKYYVANYYIRESKAPLKQYFLSIDSSVTDREYLLSWAKASIPFKEYGSYVLQHYPLEYAQYFMGLNLRHYFFPPLEKLEVYNLGSKTVWRTAKDWFDYESRNVKVSSYTAQKNILRIFPTLFFFINICFIGSVAYLLISKKFKKLDKENRLTIFLIVLFWLLNFSFSVFSTMNVLRYQVIPLILLFSYTILLIEWADRNVTVSQAANPVLTT